MPDQVNEPAPRTGAHAVVANALAAQAARETAAPPVDPARRPDVLFRVRREEGQQVSAWWLVGAFVGVSAVVILLFSFVPGGA
ncbi:MAG: UDP-N-acetylmuramyl pentapeptide phosphotransferase [Microbacterium sp.]|uniref:UDP-N-acetylmuramyl pentapeptide phosphotransferase n=1 Tax=Microbacterium sp. TaxID=51671 RepID=UPI0039E54ACB